MASQKAHRRKHRERISCDRCIRLKRRCSRDQPCDECVAKRAVCTWAGISSPASRRRLEHRAGSVPRTGICLGDHHNSGLVDLPNRETDASATVTEELVGLMRQDVNFLDSVLAIWFEDIDWMYALTKGTDLHRRWVERTTRDQCPPGSSSASSPGNDAAFGAHLQAGSTKLSTLLSIVALVAQLSPNNFEALLLRALTEQRRQTHASNGRFSTCLKQFSSAAQLAKSCWVEAERATAEAFAQESLEGPEAPSFLESRLPKRRKSSQRLDADTFTTLLHLSAFLKNTGERHQYRESLSRDIARLQRCGFHRWGSGHRPALWQLEQSQRDSDTLQGLRIFWAYFTYDRLSIMLDPTPHVLQASQCEAWLDDGWDSVDLEQLCSAALLNKQRDRYQHAGPSWTRGKASAALPLLSPYPTTMARLAAIAGAFTDELGTLQKRDVNAEQLASEANELAARLENSLNDVQGRWEIVFGEAQKLESACAGETPAFYDVLQLTSPRDLQRGAHVIAMSVDKLRRDFALQLSRTLSSRSRSTLQRQIFHERRLQAAQALISRSTCVASDIRLYGMGWSFFLFYTAEPVCELLEACQVSGVSTPLTAPHSSRQREHLHGSQLPLALERLASALDGRNLIVLIAREVGNPLAREISENLSRRAGQVLGKIVAEFCPPSGTATGPLEGQPGRSEGEEAHSELLVSLNLVRSPQSILDVTSVVTSLDALIRQRECDTSIADVAMFGEQATAGLPSHSLGVDQSTVDVRSGCDAPTGSTMAVEPSVLTEHASQLLGPLDAGSAVLADSIHGSTADGMDFSLNEFTDFTSIMQLFASLDR